MNVTQEAINTIEEVARVTLGWPKHRRWESTDKDARFKSLFGASSTIVAEIWHRIEETVAAEDPNAERKHLLWALVFLKVYATSEEVHCAIVGWPHVQTFRKYSWYFVEKMFDLQSDVIVWGNRFNGQPDMENIQFDCMISVDCLDCPCSEPFPAVKSIYSKKFNGPGIKYEVGICIKTGHIVWINGPFPAGNSEKTIFRNGLLLELADPWELVECDTGLRGCDRARIPDQAMTIGEGKQKSVVRGRHENINGKLKVFNVLVAYFHHHAGKDRDVMLNKHGLCFGAVAVITQLKLASGEIPYDVEYDVHYS
jgi:hypothetical protein